ncbi:2Fe-2S iron-sulfur cluster binding domain containing protein [Nitzschia inconspicua]|uniref:2Fe-2S iron-sulfur cluster binding domain containing protein n=1 Tax=Nitzschia inconspicua TaxID=303405 RepID=A0A9K3M5X1_9STRA|nr:2Fe-2S iron-sulfur cluster binding domain containing protein [Nitzschia inconspicua]
MILCSFLSFIAALSLLFRVSLCFHPQISKKCKIQEARSVPRWHSSTSFTQLDATIKDGDVTTAASYPVKVFYENQSITISVREDETILAALERHQISDRLSLPNHMVPSDCRRGNCLTCTGTHTNNSNLDSVVTDDGLSPHMSRWMRHKGFLLTCSSVVVGEGLELRLGENGLAWEEMYKTRLETDQARVLGWAAMARTKRQSDERNLPRWTKETEGVLRERIE